MKTSDFDYDLPKELIAQKPAAVRDRSRLMVLNRKTQTIEHRRFFEIVDYLHSGDLLVLNDTKVIPANLAGIKEEGGAKVEVLLATKCRGSIWECLVRPGKRLKVGSKVIFGDGKLIGKVLEKKDTGEQIIEFKGELEKFMRECGEIPLPPYIKKNSPPQSPSLIKRGGRVREGGELYNRYQTVYAKKEGASAAPTAGLHFTDDLLKKIKARGIGIAYVTLHTGLATFRPVWEELVENHKMYSEYFEVPPETIEAVKNAKRVIAVGTTTVRALETIGNSPSTVGFFREGGELKGETNLFIYPGYKFKVVDAMITNLHWPRSTLIMLVSAFAGRDFVMRSYRQAAERKYRFYSFGDAMFVF